jgi:2-polyprenyl-6-methoxyphenol hydroxylase-like FAD-dependent oxidoreductase
MRVGVVGAGIGGLTTAIALRARGIEAVVFEQAEEPRAVGAGLHLWSNAVRALREIGAWEQIEPLTVSVEREQILTSGGRLMAEWDVASASLEIGAPSIGMNRPDLLGALLRLAGRDVLRLGRRALGFVDDGRGVTLRFEDGSEERVDVVVGSDGIHSLIRTQLHGPSPPVYRGYTTWRTLVPADDALAPPGLLRQYWGRGVRFVFFPAGPGQIYFVGLANAPAGEKDVEGRARDGLLARFADFVEPVPSLIRAAEAKKLLRMDITDRNPMRRWGRGRVTLLGDAAHPMTPNTSQGAAMAIEDSAVLARFLGAGGDPAEGLRAYERRRWKRCAEQVMMARFPGMLGRLENPVACRLRDAYIDMTFGGPVWRSLKKILRADF